MAHMANDLQQNRRRETEKERYISTCEWIYIYIYKERRLSDTVGYNLKGK